MDVLAASRIKFNIQEERKRYWADNSSAKQALQHLRQIPLVIRILY